MENMYRNRDLSDVIVAVDVGTTKISVIAGRMTEYDKVEILAYSNIESEGVLRGVVSNIEKTVKNISDAVKQIERKLDAKVQVVYVGIAGMNIKSMKHRGILMRDNSHDEISKADIERLVSDMHKLVLPPGDKILHVLPQEYTVDNEQGITNPIGMPGIRLEALFHIVTGPLMTLQNTNKCFEKAGLKIAKMTLEPIASAAAVLSEEEKEAGVALVDIGGGTTDLTIYSEGIIRHTAIIPIGGNIITKDIKEGCTVMLQQAEKLKLKFGSALSDEVIDNRIITIPGHKGREAKEISEKNLSLIIQARMQEILDYIYSEIRRSGLEEHLTCGIVLTGGGSRLKNIDILTQYHTGMSARVGYPVDHLAHGYPEVLSSPVYSTAVGLLVNALTSPNPKFGMEIKREIRKPELVETAVESIQRVEPREINKPEQKIQVNKLEVENTKPSNPEEKGNNANKSNFFKKFFDSAKDFFEGEPDSDLR